MIQKKSLEHQNCAIERLNMVNNPQTIHCCFTDFEELAEAVRSWNLDFQKLDCGPFTGEILQIISPDFIYGYGAFAGCLKQTGEPPAGYRTFAISAVAPFEMIWRGHAVNESNLVLFPKAAELHAFTNVRFEIFTISIAEELLYQWINPKNIQGLEVFACNPKEITTLRNMLQKVKTQGTQSATKDLILFQIATLLQTSGLRSTKQTPRYDRINSILKTERHILENRDDAPSVTTLASVAGISRRTLEYSFAEHLGISPKTFINNTRLNAVRKILRAGDVPKIADAANTWGFWHMGQFAADYRKLFGELPSVTLKNPC